MYPPLVFAGREPMSRTHDPKRHDRTNVRSADDNPARDPGEGKSAITYNSNYTQSQPKHAWINDYRSMKKPPGIDPVVYRHFAQLI